MSQAGTDRGIVTPEAVRLELETAGVGSRTLAYLLDLLIMGAILSSLSSLFVLAMAGAGTEVFAVVLLILLISAVQFGYPIAFEVLWRGRTPGKAALGLRVVTREGGPVRLRHAAIRAVLGLVDFLLTFGAVAVISVLVTRNDQRLGDLAAGTVVLRERVSQPSAIAVRFPPPRGLEGWVDTFDVSRLDERGYLLARAFLLRAGALPPLTRERLAREVAEAVVRDVRTQPPPIRLGPALFLQCVAAAYQARHAPPASLPPPPTGPPLAAPWGVPTPADGPGGSAAPPAAAPAIAAEAPAPTPAPQPPRDRHDGGFAPPS